MLVKDYMTRHPIMIGPELRLTEAQKLMTDNNIRHLPIVGDGKRLQGLVTRQRLTIPAEKLTSLDMWEITRYLADLTVSKVMVKGPDLRTIHPDATMEDAADLMIRHKIGSLPVVEDGDIVVGIITETDLLVELQHLLGANETGWRATVRVPDRVGEFSKITRAMVEHDWGIMAMGSVRAPKQPGYWDVVLKVRRCTRDELLAVLKQIPDQQLIDLRETTVYTD
jgi:acetoin utilization protein AcuB